MTVSIDATVGGLSANSYVTVGEADSYVGTFILTESNREAWSDVAPDDKARLLIQATRQLDWYFQWVGERVNIDQALCWPRYEAYREEKLLPYNEIPFEVKHATIEQALWLRTQQDTTPVDGPFQINDIAVGSIRVNFNEKSGGQAKIYMPDKVAAILRELGEATAPEVPMAGQAHAVKLVRG